MDSFNVPLTHLSPSPLNCRSKYEQKALEALAEDIAKNGLINPLLVRSKAPEGSEAVAGVVGFRYEIICGFRRFEAAKLGKLDHVPVRLMTLNDLEAHSRIQHEAKDREDFHFLDRAEGWRRWNEAGASIEKIAEEMKVSRATVYSTIALRHLTPETKRACWDDKIGETTARELATVPAKLQGAALKDCLSPGFEGRAKTVRDQIDVIRTKYRLDLRKAIFDPADATLDPQAGACTPCQYRTGTQPELFSDQPDNQCTNLPCHKKKSDLQWLKMIEDGLHQRGPKCLSDTEAQKYFLEIGGGQLREDAPFVVAAEACHDDVKARPYKELLGRTPNKHLVLARMPSSNAVVELLPKAKLKETLDEAGVIKRRAVIDGKTVQPINEEPQLSKEEAKAQREKAARRAVVTKKVIAAIVSKVAKRGSDKKVMRTLADALVHAGGCELIWARRGVEEAPSKYLDRLGEGELLGFVFEGLLEFQLYADGPKYAPRLLELAKEYAVEVKTFEHEAMAAERAKPEVKKAKAKA